MEKENCKVKVVVNMVDIVSIVVGIMLRMEVVVDYVGNKVVVIQIQKKIAISDVLVDFVDD